MNVIVDSADLLLTARPVSDVSGFSTEDDDFFFDVNGNKVKYADYNRAVSEEMEKASTSRSGDAQRIINGLTAQRKP